MSTDGNQPLVNFLTEQGLRWDEIEKVLVKLEDYDKRTFHDCVFESIERGSFNLQEIIDEVRDES